MKEYIKGNRRLRIVDKGDGYVLVTYTVEGKEVCSVFLPKNAYKSSIRFILSTWR